MRYNEYVANINEIPMRPQPSGASAETPRGLSTSAQNGAGYGLGYRAGQTVAQTRAAVEQKIEAVRQAPRNAAYNARQKVAQAQQKITQAPKMAAEKRLAIRQNVGVGASAGLRQTQRIGGYNAPGLRQNSRRLALSRPASWEEEKKNLAENAKKMAVKGGPVLFWLVAGIAIAKDIIDVFSAILDLAGVGLSATGVGAPVGIPLTILSEVIDKIAGFMIDFTLVAYFGYIGGGFALRLVIMSIGAIIDAIPGIDVLPLTTLTFFAAYIFGRVTKKIVQFAESKAGKVLGKTGRFIGKLGRAAARA